MCKETDCAPEGHKPQTLHNKPENKLPIPNDVLSDSSDMWGSTDVDLSDSAILERHFRRTCRDDSKS